MNDVLDFVVAAGIALAVSYAVRRLIGRNNAGPEPGDYAGSRVRLGPRPKRDAGAVALIEPDDEA